MRRGGKFVGTVAMLSVAACGGEQGKLEIRSTATPLAAGQRPVPFRIAEARGQFALGNIALALEAFRMALREDPSSVDAMSGIAACYDRMARFDLSRRHYEAALAIAPADPQLLTAFAASLTLQGRSAEAAAVRNEVAQRLALATATRTPQAAVAATPVRAGVVVTPRRAAEPNVLPKPAKTTQLAERPAAPRPTNPVQARPVQTAVAPPAVSAQARPATSLAIGRSVTIALPPAQPPKVEAPATHAVQTAVRAAPPPARSAAVQPPVKPAIEASLEAARPPVQAVVEAPPAKPAAPTGVTLALRPAPSSTPAPAAPVATAVTLALPAPRPAAAAAPAKPPVEEPVKIARAEPVAAKQAPDAKSGPRIERTSLLEVALITAAEPKWRALTVRRTQRSATVRFVPERHASLSLTGIRILNAARVNRLAARTRSYLVGRGWTPMRIGNAQTVRARSVILYPPHRRRTAERLSAQFGFVIAQRPGSRQITVLLGRDAVRLPALRASA